MTDRWDVIRVSLARKFYLACVLQAAAILLLGCSLGLMLGRQEPSARLRLPGAFLVSTVFLFVGSAWLEWARNRVRLERQAEFRTALKRSLVFAALFVAVQGYGLWAMHKGERSPDAAQTGVHGFVVMLTALHAMHFIVAQSILLWVTLSAYADRYDHEYYWGVTFAAFFWHVLGVVWLGILFVFTTSLAV